MKKFSVFRYLKQFSLLIFLLAILGSFAIYRYGKSKQQYIASTVIVAGSIVNVPWTYVTT